MKCAIDLMCRKLAASEYSHQTSWAHLRANQLKNIDADLNGGTPQHTYEVMDFDGRRHSRDWREFDLVYIYHGMDYRPGPYLNVFDGLVEHAAKFFSRLSWPQHAHLQFVSLDLPMPPYGQLCKVKKGTQSDYWKAVDWDEVQRKCESITTWYLDPCQALAPGKYRHLTIGDSHAHSVYRPTGLIIRKDERTLAGVLRKTIEKEITDYGFKLEDVDSLTCYWGSIDIRHHLCREPDPRMATEQLLKNYEQSLEKLGRPIELVTILPIEDESRVIPLSGYYKPPKQTATPFFGSRAERQAVLQQFNDGLEAMAAKHPGWSVYRWPRIWYEMDGVEFMNEYMERPRSVHLARKYYRWDLANNCANQRLLTVAPQEGKKPLLQF